MIQLKDITKAYQMGRVEFPVLHGLDLVINDGEMVAIMRSAARQAHRQ